MALRSSAITPQKIADYKRHRRSQGLKTGTIAKELELLRASLNVAMKEREWLAVNPFWKVRIDMPRKSKDWWLKHEEETLLLTECPDWLRDIVTFALNTGLRQNELFSVMWKDVDLKKKTVTVVETKNGELRTTTP